MSIPHVIRAGIEGWIWAIIIIGSLVVRIIKANKERSSQPTPAPPGPRPATPEPDVQWKPPEDELREFLERLGGKPVTPPPPPPPPAGRQVAPPPPPPTARPKLAPQVLRAPAPQKTFRRKPTRAAPAPAPAPAIAPAPAPAPRRPAPKPIPAVAVAPVRTAGRRSEYRKVLDRLMKERSTLRSAIVVRDVLGPPLALRTHGG